MGGAVGMADERDIFYMRLALQEALKGQQTPGGAEVGAVLIRRDKVLASGFNEGELRHDPTAHAEIVVLRRAGDSLQTTDLRGCTLYCTLQPCGMCTMACLWAGISRIVYGAGKEDVNHIYFETRQADTFDFIREVFRDDLRIEGRILATECGRLYAGPKEHIAEKDPAHKSTIPPA